MLRLQYPNIRGNSLCDGRVHNITPYTVSRIEDLELFLLEYYDESMACDCTTILLRRPDGSLCKIPLKDYDLLFEMIGNNILRLTDEDLFVFFATYYSKRDSFIPAEAPVKDFHECLTQARAAIILYIDANKNIYYRKGLTYVRVNADLLLQLMQAYDIEWHRKETKRLASQSEIDAAIHNTLGHRLKEERHDDGLSYEERYKIDNIHHYSVSYQYTDSKGFKRGSSSI